MLPIAACTFFICIWKKRKDGSIYFRCMIDARLFKPKQTFNRVSPVLVFSMKKWFAYNNPFYVLAVRSNSRTYDVNVAKCLSRCIITYERYFCTWVRSSRELETHWSHKFSGNTAKSVCKKTPRNLNFPRI